jgi:hypothetical protein
VILPLHQAVIQDSQATEEIRAEEVPAVIIDKN